MINRERDLTPERARDLYSQLDHEINTRIGVEVGFTTLIATERSFMSEEEVERFRSRYHVIKSFQEQSLALFKASLRGDADPEIANMVLDEMPAHLGRDHHITLSEEQHQTPVFFRTDDLPPGKLSEIQCSGSGWGLAQQLRVLYESNEDLFGPPQHFPKDLARSYADSLRAHIGTEPVVHHLVDNASRPHGARYFIQHARAQGLRYFSYDRNSTPADCNFVRSHDFVSLIHNNFYTDRMERCNRGELFFDLPPSVLFDMKIAMAWPFWEKTRNAYTDEVRKLFPYTTIIDAGGFALEEGEHLSLDGFLNRRRVERDYYLKYAGSDVATNWGSKSVFLASSSSTPALMKTLERIVSDRKLNRFWIAQKAIRARENVTYLDRSGEQRSSKVHTKRSGFYGPDGLMAILSFQRNALKVHGSDDTILSIVH